MRHSRAIRVLARHLAIDVMTTPAARTTQDLPRDWLSWGLWVALVVGALVWALNVPGRLGIVLYAEQALAGLAGVALAAAVLAAVRPRGLARGFAAAVLVAFCVIAWDYPALSIRAAMRPPALAALSVFIVLAVLVLVWRMVSPVLAVLLILFSALALWGGVLGVPTTAPVRLPLYLVLDPNALLGLPLRVAIEVVIPFLFFGELLRVSGGGKVLTDLALAVFGGYRGGGAKAAIGASALFGSVSGNAVSNVVGTGIVTIPLIKRTGFSAAMAGAVEAVASTGGQLLPPVMGAAAFVMADLLRVPYTDILVAAAIPAGLYFAAVFFQVDRLAARIGAKPVPLSDRMALGPMARPGLLLSLPFLAMFAVLFLFGNKPQYAAVAACVTLIALAVVVPLNGRRLRLVDLSDALAATGKSAVPLMVIVAAAGVLIGLIGVTGLGFSIAVDAIRLAGGSGILLLVLVAGTAILFGMGMPTVAVYVVLATILAPALVQSGVPEMSAHLFIFYFGMMSMLTPPVALASITAARIAGADPWQTSFAALRLGWVAYLVPFLFVASPALLMDAAPLLVVQAALAALGGILAISAAFAGFSLIRIGMVQRFFYLVAGACLLVPVTFGAAALIANLAGAALVAALMLRERMVTARLSIST